MALRSAPSLTPYLARGELGQPGSSEALATTVSWVALTAHDADEVRDLGRGLFREQPNKERRGQMSTIEQIRETRSAKGLPHWKPSQRRRLRECVQGGAEIVYWNSDRWGRPANGGTGGPVRVGLVQEVEGPLALCGPRALHATKEPHRWKGERVWVVAMWGPVVWNDDKCGSLKREILGEILPEEAWVSASVAARMGIAKYLYGANLSGANLERANLSGANLERANLSGANLERAYRGSSTAVAGWRTSATGYLERDAGLDGGR